MRHGDAAPASDAAVRAIVQRTGARATRSQRVRRWANDQATKAEHRGLLLLGLLSLAYWSFTWSFAARKLMWNDELYTFYIASLPTKNDVLAALMARGEQTPPFFYLITRGAFALFGAGEMSLRLPEMLGFWVMSVCLFVYVRRTASAVPALCAAAFPLVTTAYSYAFEGRPYGVVLAFAAVALVCWQACTDGRRRRLWTVGLAASLSATVSVHYYGVFVLLPLGLGEIVRSLARRRVDLPIWAAFAVPIAVLAAHFPLISAGTAYSGAFWSPPQWLNLPAFYEDLLAPAVVPLAVTIGLAVVYVALASGDEAPPAGPEPAVPRHDLAVACGLLAIPVVCVILAKLATGAFVNRYAIAAVLGCAMMAGFAVALGFRRQPILRLAALLCVVGWFVLGQAREHLEPTGFSVPVSRASIERPAAWVAAVPEQDLPVVIADPHTFTVLSHYGSPELRSRIVYLADPDLALKRLGHNSVERGMLDLIRPWFRMHVEPFPSFLTEHQRFLVYGDFVRLSFLNWLLPELHARGIHTELLERGGDNLLLLASRGDTGPGGRPGAAAAPRP